MKKEQATNITFAFWILVAVGLNFLFPLRRIVPFPFTLLGIPLFAAGVALNVHANRWMARHHTALDAFATPTHLVSEGPFRVSRNPVYLSAVIQLFGIAVLLGSLSALLVVIAWFLTLSSFFIPPEEKVMTDIFGQDYLDYKRRVRRWL